MNLALGRARQIGLQVLSVAPIRGFSEPTQTFATSSWAADWEAFWDAVREIENWKLAMGNYCGWAFWQGERGGESLCLARLAMQFAIFTPLLTGTLRAVESQLLIACCVHSEIWCNGATFPRQRAFSSACQLACRQFQVLDRLGSRSTERPH